MVIWHKVGGFLIIGYLCTTRSFAYLGIPPLKLFIGEIALAAFLFLKPRVALGTLAASLLRPSPLNALALALLIFIVYGIWQVGRGVLGGSPMMHTLKYFVFNYYTIYLLMGIWIGIQAPDFLPRLIRVLAWANGIYGLAYILVLNDVDIPGSSASLFGQPAGSAVAILGLLCIGRDIRSVWLLLVLNLIVTLTMQVRAEWLGLAVGLLVWGILTSRLGRLVATGLAALALLGLIEVTGVQLTGRSGSVSLGETLGRVIAPINLELAEEFSPNAEHHAGTMAWRQQWWEEIWRSVHSTPMLASFGHGYGFDLFALAPGDVRAGQAAEIRTPHNVFYYALGYTGWVGVVLFGLVQFAIFRALRRAFRVGGQPAGLLWWSAGLSMAFFSNFFETPFGAIPFYLLVGMGMAPALQSHGDLDARPARAQFLSVARR